jgi:membrane protease YdiL (CAAX protease family)
MSIPKDLCSALACAAFLAGYGNVFNLLAPRIGGIYRHIYAVAGPLALLATACTCHWRLDRRPLVELGLHCNGWRRSVAWGTLAGALMALPPFLYFRRRSRSGAVLQSSEISDIGVLAFLVRLFVVTPLLVAFVEEVAFRGWLQGKLHRALPRRPHLANALASAAFAAWHVVVNRRTLQGTNAVHDGLVSLPAALVGGLASVFAAGFIFGALYHRTRSLVAPVLCHWLVDALMLVTLYTQRPRCAERRAA